MYCNLYLYPSFAVPESKTLLDKVSGFLCVVMVSTFVTYSKIFGHIFSRTVSSQPPEP